MDYLLKYCFFRIVYVIECFKLILSVINCLEMALHIFFLVLNVNLNNNRRNCIVNVNHYSIIWMCDYDHFMKYEIFYSLEKFQVPVTNSVVIWIIACSDLNDCLCTILLEISRCAHGKTVVIIKLSTSLLFLCVIPVKLTFDFSLLWETFVLSMAQSFQLYFFVFPAKVLFFTWYSSQFS